MNSDIPSSLDTTEMEGIDDGEERSFFVRALYDFHSNETSSLSFKKGTLIEVLTQLESGWWDGLLGNDVRGWFPSNYVERISDEEAEAEFQSQQDFADLTKEDGSNDFLNSRFNKAVSINQQNGDDEFLAQQREEDALQNALQRNAAKSVGSQYSGLGLGQDFNTLRRLMDSVGSSEDEGMDAFEQLAEATMTNSAQGTTNGNGLTANDAKEERLGIIDARRRSRMSDQSSVLGSLATSNGTTYSNVSQTDISSMKTRSNAASFSEAEHSRKATLAAAESSKLALLNANLELQEKERLRAHTVSETEGPQQDQQFHIQQLAGRPRAQTAHAGMTSSSSTNSSGSQTTGAFTPSIKGSKVFGNESDSFWIPKVNDEGEIYYFNTQTGRQSRDLPQGVEMGNENDLSSSEQMWTGEAQRRRQSGALGNNKKIPSAARRYKSHQSGPSNTTLSSEAEESRPTSSNSLYTASTKQSRFNTIDKMPDANQIPFPWIVRTSDDERTFYLFNRQTHEISHDIDAILAHTSNNVDDQKTVRTPGRNLSDTSSVSNLASTRFARSNSGAQQALKRPEDLLRYRNSDQAEILAYQERMSNDQSLVELRTMIDKTGDAIAILASMASEEIGEDGLSEQDARTLGESQNSLKDESRLSLAISNVVESICSLLRAAGALNISPIDLLNASEAICINQDSPNEGEALQGFQHSIAVLQGRSLNVNESSESDLYVTAAGFDAISSPPASLVPLGKKINATLSKLVLSARSVVEQSCLNAIERPTFNQAQLEKILSYRNRIKDDSMDLARALGVFSNEAAQPPIFGRSSGYTTQRRPHAYLKSGKADSGIGLNVFGGGSAAGWRGNGFVLPSAKEAAVLRAKIQMPEMHLQDLTKEAKEAFSFGSIALRRKPTLPLSREIIEGTITSKFSHYAEILSELRSLLISKEEGECDEIPAQLVIETSTKVFRQFGALISWIEEVDLASALDVDGPALDDVRTSTAESEDYHSIVLAARQTLHKFGNVKQAAFDASQTWLMCIQDRTTDALVLPEQLRLFEVDEEAIRLVDKLGFTAVQLQSLLAELLHLSETQAKYGFSSMGGRSKVHGIADVKMKMVEDRVTKAKEADVQNRKLSLNTSNLTTTVAPPVSSSSASSSTAMAGPAAIPPAPTQAPDAKMNNVPSSSLRAMFQRARSTSVATGASAASNDSSRLTAAGQEDIEGVKGMTRLRRDTVDGQSSTTIPSAPGSSTGDHLGDGAVKSAEEIPWFLQPDTPPEDLVLNANQQVKGATLSALMERLTMHNAFDSSFNSTFLMTYRSFTTTDELLDFLFARFRIQEPQGLTIDEHELWIEKKQRPIRFRVFNVLKSWLESQFHENENEMHMKRIRDFALDEMAHSPAMAMPANLLLRIIERRSGTGEQMKITMVMPSSAPPPILPKNFRKIKFLDIDPLEMARQLTLMDSRLYNRIRPAECLGKAWSREDGAAKAKGVRDVIGANNRVSGWVSEAILVQEDVKKRAAWVKQFVAIADRCFYLNNFSSMMAIYSGLNNASLNRLRRTWDAVNQRHLQLFENMRAILAPTRNFTRYRETLRKLNPPCVPFLGVYLTDLTFIEDGNTDRLRTDERLINFSKRQMTAEKIGEIMIYQSTPYNLTPVPGIQKFIEENLIDARTDDELFEQSLRLEPREREDEKIARLLQESGFL